MTGLFLYGPMRENNYHVVIVITGETVLTDQDSFKLLVDLEELFYAHYLMASFIDTPEHEEAGTSKVIHINQSKHKDQIELEKHLKLADLIVCVGLNKSQSELMKKYFDLAPSDCSLFEINDEESFLYLGAEKTLLNLSFSHSIQKIMNIL